MSNRKRRKQRPGRGPMMRTVPADVAARVRADLACEHCAAAIKVTYEGNDLAARVRHTTGCAVIPVDAAAAGQNVYSVRPILYKLPVGSPGSLN